MDNQVRMVAIYLLLVLERCGGRVADPNDDGHAVTRLRQYAHILDTQEMHNLMVDALRFLEETGKIHLIRGRSRINDIVLCDGLDLTEERSKEAEIVRTLIKDRCMSPQQKLTYQELETYTLMGFTAIASMVETIRKERKKGHCLYSIDPLAILEYSEVPNDAIGTVISHLARLGIVKPSPYHRYGVWVVLAHKQVSTKGLRSFYKQSMQ
jgi:hypothetical protein